MEHFEHDYFLGLRNFGGILFFEYILVDLNLLNSFTAAKNPKEAYELLVNTVKDNKKVLLSEVPDMLKDDTVQENGIDLIISRIEIEKNIPYTIDERILVVETIKKQMNAIKYHALPDTIINEFKEQYKKDPRTEKLTNPFLYQPK